MPRRSSYLLPLSNPNLLGPFVEACLRDGVTLIAVVGEGGSKIEHLIDRLIVRDGSDESRFIVTSSHPGETIEEVMAFARRWDEELGQPVELVNL
jgi:hypothetical protein